MRPRAPVGPHARAWLHKDHAAWDTSISLPRSTGTASPSSHRPHQRRHDDDAPSALAAHRRMARASRRPGAASRRTSTTTTSRCRGRSCCAASVQAGAPRGAAAARSGPTAGCASCSGASGSTCDSQAHPRATRRTRAPPAGPGRTARLRCVRRDLRALEWQRCGITCNGPFRPARSAATPQWPLGCGRYYFKRGLKVVRTVSFGEFLDQCERELGAERPAEDAAADADAEGWYLVQRALVSRGERDAFSRLCGDLFGTKPEGGGGGRATDGGQRCEAEVGTRMRLKHVALWMGCGCDGTHAPSPTCTRACACMRDAGARTQAEGDAAALRQQRELARGEP